MIMFLLSLTTNVLACLCVWSKVTNTLRRKK
jgi:hypothetical protein